jgi:hypothetical protein
LSSSDFIGGRVEFVAPIFNLGSDYIIS